MTTVRHLVYESHTSTTSSTEPDDVYLSYTNSGMLYSSRITIHWVNLNYIYGVFLV